MPHQCTNCGRAFEDGSKEMLSGCPDCGGNKFQFLPAGAVGETGGSGTTAGGTAPKKTPQTASASNTANASNAASASSSRDPPETGGGTDESSGAVDRAAATVRDWVSTRRNRGERDQSAAGTAQQSRSQAQSSTRQQSRSDSRSGSTRNEGAQEQTAAPEAESSEDSAQASARRDLVSADELPDDPPETEGNVVSPPEEESPGLDELRKELNDQFESIRIVNPGHYELNLMELYNREEYIIALKEDGKYVIEVPDSWEQQ